jgi:hypothetical protein
MMYKVGYLQPMKQHSVLVIVVRSLFVVGFIGAIVTGCSTTQPSTTSRASQPTVALENMEPGEDALSTLAEGVATLTLSGTMSIDGTMSFSGLPFTATMVEKDSFRITMSGPMGITAARLYGTPGYFTLVNYFEQSVMDGNPASRELSDKLPFPISVPEIASLIRGEVPGSPSRFRRQSERPDGLVLYRAGYDGGVEFALIDAERRVLKQYQRKNAAGALLLNVTFDDVRTVNGKAVAHAVDVAVDEKRQSMQFLIDKVAINEPVRDRLAIDIPSSFRRTTFR